MITTHVPRLPGPYVVSPPYSRDTVCSPNVEKNTSDQVLYNKTPKNYPVPSTVNTKMVNNESYGVSERVSIELGRVNIPNEDK